MSQPVAHRFVVDASVVLKWYLKDETFSAEADRILAAYGDGRISLVAPQHIHYEVSNAIQTAVRRNRITSILGRQIVLDFLQQEFPLVVGTHLIVKGWDASQHYGCALYDGLYVALADMTGSYLVHADRRLRNTLAGRFANEMWIEDLIDLS